MRPLTSEDILTLWDRGSRLHPLQRALSLLAAGCPERSLDELARLPIDQRDHLLLQLRVLTFGRRLEAVVACPQCQQWLELELPTAALLEAPTSGTHGAAIELSLEGATVKVRAPTTEDLLAVAAAGDEHGARACLLERCVEVAAPMELTHEQRRRALDRLVEHLPHVESTCELVCPACSHTWCEDLDMGEYLWAELRASARRLLLEVHVLARAYGWREADLLAMSPARRDAYLSMVTA